jgi:hypothetical protein
MDTFKEESIIKHNFIFTIPETSTFLVKDESGSYQVFVQRESMRSSGGWLTPKLHWQGDGIGRARKAYKKIVARYERRSFRGFYNC